MKTAVWKNFYREIRQYPGRFLSILFIVLLGVSFLSGVRACEPDMQQSLTAYMNRHKYMDVKIQSTLGLTEADVRAARKVDGISEAVGACSTDVLSDYGNQTQVLHVMSTVRGMNMFTVKSGRLPRRQNECLLDAELAKERRISVGDKIPLYSGTKAKLSKSLKYSSFTVTGIGSSPAYLTEDRGSTTLGNGTVDGFIAVRPSAFSMDSYSAVYCRVTGAEKYTTGSAAYKEKVRAAQKHLRKLAASRCRVRLGQMKQRVVQTVQASYPGIDRASAEAIAQKQMKKLGSGKWYVQGRAQDQAYAEYLQNAERIAAIGKVFPLIFFLVAALVSLTAMTRMVEEEREQIGLMEALGYGRGVIIRKFAGYSLLATVTGSIAGVLIGEKMLPYIIINAYRNQFVNMDQTVIPYEWKFSLLAASAAVICNLTATFWACGHLLKEVPSQLMRPEAPKNGSRIWLERITPLWKRLNFSSKATLRNIFRYKKRLFMTMIGIGGCTALLLTGFGIRDAVTEISVNQYSRVQTYDAQLIVNPDASASSRAGLSRTLKNTSEIGSTEKLYQDSVTMKKGGKSYSGYVVVPKDPDRLGQFISLHDRVSGKKYHLNDHSVILTEKAASLLHVKKGSRITLKLNGSRTVRVKVGAVAENYVLHYVYISPSYYRQLTGKNAESNSILLNWKGRNVQEKAVSRKLLKNDAVSQIRLTSDAKKAMKKTVDLLRTVVGVLSGAAAMLAFVVMFNLNSISITERRRELATLKVLGFYDGEVSMYIFRENIILTGISIVLGLFLGVWLKSFIMSTAETNDLMFGRTVAGSSFLLAALLTVFFAVIVNGISSISMRRIDMIESLKSVE
jgi:putative ABC transport system permease protein